MNVNTGIKQAVILAIGIIMLGFCIKSGLESVIAKDRKVVVKGLAENSKSKIDKIMNADQGQFSIEDRDSNTPYIKKVRVVTTVTYSLKD